MDYAADSDTENSLPLISVSDVDTAAVRHVVAFFPEETRRRVCLEAQNTPFAALFEDSNANDVIGTEILDFFSPPGSPDTEPVSSIYPPGTSVPDLQHVNEVLSQTQTEVQLPPQNPPEPGFRRPRSLRKRTFASRHPYIADQADWLGICTVDSINEMFDGDEDITRVVRALNQLYLQKKRRYPDEDRYRSKDFYTHLGHSKSLALQGDPDMGESGETEGKTKEAEEELDSQEQNYDPHIHSSQLNASADEVDDDMLIPYEDFEIPYTQDASHNYSPVSSDGETTESHQHVVGIRENAENVHIEESSDYESAEEAEEEQYIKIGGRYRKISTILRGVLPESAKRLGIFDRQTSSKRRKPSARTITPRRGLAMKKTRASGSNSADLQRELYASLGQNQGQDHDQDQNEESRPISSKQHSLDRFERLNLEKPVPYLSRASTSFSYMSDTPEPQYIDSGSDSEPEIYTMARPVSDYIQSLAPDNENISHQERYAQPIDLVDVEEHDEIDHLLAPRDNALRKGFREKVSKRPSAAGPRNPRSSEKRPYSRQRQGRINAPKISLGRPAATKQRVSNSKPRAYTRRPKVLDKLQTRLPAFRQTLHGERSYDTPDYAISGDILQRKQKSNVKQNVKQNPKQKSKSKSKQNPVSGPRQPPIQQHFKRGPVMSTSAIEIESTTKLVGSSTATFNSVTHRFDPTRKSLLGSISSTSSTSLTGLEDTGSVRGLRDGRVFFPNEDTITINFLGTSFVFALFNREESFKNNMALLTSLKRILSTPKLLLKPEVNSDIHGALKSLIKWHLMCRERPSGALWSQMKVILDEFTKFQIKEVRVLQISIQSQFMFIFWVLIQLEHRYKSDQDLKLMKYLTGYCSDFFVIFFTSFTASDLSSAYLTESPTHELYQSVMLIFTIFEKENKCWWPPMTQAIDEMVLFGNEITGLLDLAYLLGAIIPKKNFSWSPFLILLNKLKTAADSLGHRHFIETCELAHQRLDWPYDEKILTQLYGLFGARKFSNFVDESSVPSSVGVVHSRADIPGGSVFERFLGLLYIYISELSSAKEVKRLLSKLLASSQYHYVRGRKSQIMFANRLNLILLLSQISDVDLGSQLTNLIVQICASADPFVYGRSLDALQVFSETAVNRKRALPIKAFVELFKSLAEMTIRKSISQSIFLKLIDLMGQTFRGTSSNTNEGVFGLLKILSSSDISTIPDAAALEVLGTALLSIMEVEIFDDELDTHQISIFVDFQKSLLKLLSKQMERLPASKPEEDQSIEETIELAIQIWMLSSKIMRTQHWNNMMYQRYSYLGNSIARNRFVMFLCLEFIQYATVDSFVLQEIEKIFLNGLVSPSLSKYSVDLYRSLSQNPDSVFYAKDSHIPEMTSTILLQTFRLRIITQTLENIVGSLNLHGNEKSGIISSLVKRLHDVYTDHHFEQGVTDMCKKITETIQRTAKSYIANLDEFWELSTKLGFPNKNIQSKWSNSNGRGKVQLLNTEFITALAYGKSHVVAMDNWKTEENDLILFTLVQVYSSALGVSSAYWAHICLLLDYIYAKIEGFQIITNDHTFMEFLALLKELSFLSNHRNDSRYTLYEIRALRTCACILQYSFFIFDGYKDKQDTRHVVFEFIANVDINPPKRYNLSTVFMDLSIDALQSGSHVSYHPKYQHTTKDFEEACHDLKEVLQNLTDTVSGTVQEQLTAKGLDDYDFL